MFKIYYNKKTRHPSISIKQKDKTLWFNMSFSHSRPKHDSYIIIQDPRPKSNQDEVVFVRRYVRKDKRRIKGFLYKKYKLYNDEENLIKKYLKRKYKKR